MMNNLLQHLSTIERYNNEKLGLNENRVATDYITLRLLLAKRWLGEIGKRNMLSATRSQQDGVPGLSWETVQCQHPLRQHRPQP